MEERTPRQEEFVGRVNALLAEFGAEVGPEFDGLQGGVPVRSAVPSHWVMLVQWTDFDNGEEYAVSLTSGVGHTMRLGMLYSAVEYALQELRP